MVRLVNHTEAAIRISTCFLARVWNLNAPLGDQTHLGHHKPTHLGHHRQETHLEHHTSTHLGHHRQHFCERVVTGGHSLRSPTQTYYIPLGLDMGTWGHGV